jgi:hypothetical protein
VAAGDATNCLSCAIESSCNHSAKRLYLDQHLDMGVTKWPVKIVVPEIEELYKSQGKQKATEKLLSALGEDYGRDATVSLVEGRTWYGRCVFESDNDVCDDQVVTMTWKDDPLPGKESNEVGRLDSRGAKQAVFHMVAFTQAICERRGRIYGTEGELQYDSSNITVTNFKSGYSKTHHVPPPPDSGHGGGDDELALNMIRAVNAINHGDMDVDAAQAKFLGVTLVEVIRSHAAVFAAEQARTDGKVVQWKDFWQQEVGARLNEQGVLE